jgi:hypothetical protein
MGDQAEAVGTGGRMMQGGSDRGYGEIEKGTSISRTPGVACARAYVRVRVRVRTRMCIACSCVRVCACVRLKGSNSERQAKGACVCLQAEPLAGRQRLGVTTAPSGMPGSSSTRMVTVSAGLGSCMFAAVRACVRPCVIVCDVCFSVL